MPSSFIIKIPTSKTSFNKSIIFLKILPSLRQIIVVPLYLFPTSSSDSSSDISEVDSNSDSDSSILSFSSILTSSSNINSINFFFFSPLYPSIFLLLHICFSSGHFFLFNNSLVYFFTITFSDLGILNYINYNLNKFNFFNYKLFILKIYCINYIKWVVFLALL